MTNIRTTLCLALAGAAALASLVGGGDAYARGGKEYYSQTYQFDRPMNGYEGFSGAYHCSFIKTPKKVCLSGRCKTVWELTQTCQ